jgi:glycosyltransferase involved in cell wall biosynthesis
MAPCFGTIAKIARKNKHTRVIAILHNIIPHEKRPGDRVLSSYFVNQVDAFVSLSKSVLEDLKTFNKNKPRAFCPHPLYDHFGKKYTRQEALEKLKLPPQNRYILFFGLIRDYKGLDLLIEAFSDKRFREKNICLIIAGEFYTHPEKYMALIEKSGIKEKIVLHSRFIPDNEVGWYFGAADIVAQPYKNATQSGVTQIGFHFEKPMLVTNVGGLSEIIPHNKAGYVVEPRAGSIANALISFFEEGKKEAFEEQVKKEKKKYQWITMTSVIQKLLNQLNT